MSSPLEFDSGVKKLFASVLLGLALTVAIPTITSDNNPVPQAQTQTVTGTAENANSKITINIFYGRHHDANDFALLTPGLDAAFKNAKYNESNVVVYVENSVIGDLPYVGFAHEFEGWDAPRLIKDEAYQKEFATEYIEYLANQRKALETIDWQASRANPRQTFLAAAVRYLASKVIDDKIRIELRQEEPPLEYLIARLKSETVGPIPAVEQIRDREFAADVLTYIRPLQGNTSVIIIRGAYHQQVTELLEAAGYDVNSFVDPRWSQVAFPKESSREGQIYRMIDMIGKSVGLGLLVGAFFIGRFIYQKIRSHVK